MKYNTIRVTRGKSRGRVLPDGKCRMPSPDEFDLGDLRKATNIYRDFVTKHPGKQVPLQVFIDDLKCGYVKAQVFKAAAEFKYNMTEKGLA